MSLTNDIDSGLPVRSYQDGDDERVLVKIQDGQDPGGVDKTAEVSERKVHVRNHSKDSDGNDQEQLLSQEGHTQSNGDYDATLNKRPSSQGTILHDRKGTGETAGEADQNFRPTGVSYDDGSTVVNSADVALHDESGVPYSKDNPLPVSIEESEGDEIMIESESALLVKNASEDIEYTVTAGKEFELEQWGIAASGHMKAELYVETAASSGTFVRKGTLWNSTANPNENLMLKRAIKVVAGAIVRITVYNLENQSQSMTCFINGLEN